LYIGRPLKPLEHYRFITGRGRYVDDIRLDGAAYLKVVRSPYARALIRYAGFGGSRALLFIGPGDFEGYVPARVDPEVAQYARIVRMPVLPKGVVNFVGQPVAAIVARDPYEAEDLAEHVSVDYEVLEPVVDPFKALEHGAPQIHEEAPGNRAIDRRFVGGDTRAFREAEVVVRAELRMERIAANPIEPKACIAYYDGSKLTLYVNTQSPYRVRSDVQEVFGIPPEDIRIISPDVGGAFGVKTPLHVECMLAILASMKLKIPVKYVETRREHLVAPYHGRGVSFEVEGYATRKGELLGIRGQVIADIGAYSYGINLNIPVNIVRWSVGPYRVRAVDIELKAVYTNKTPIGPYRGAGRPEAALIHERVLDALADELGIDRADIRAINLRSGKGYYETPTGLRTDDADYLGTYMRAYEAYKKLRSTIARAPGKRVGVGISCFLAHDRSGMGERARLRVSRGRVEIYVGTHSHGQSHATTLAQVAAEELGIPIERVSISFGDTETLKEGVGTFGSRSAVAGGAAVVEVCRRLKEEARARGYAGVAQALEELEGYEVETFYRGGDVFSFGAHIAVVEVDGETGVIRVLKYIAVDDVGRAINPLVIEGQLVGGALQGAGQVLWEAVRYDDQGNPLCSSIAECGVPSSLEAFEVESVLVENPSEFPHGARGVGEAGAIGAPPALISAIEDATGVRVRAIPVSSEAVRKALMVSGPA